MEPIDLTPYRNDINLIQKVIMQLPGKQTCLKESIIVHLFFKRIGINIPIHLGVSTKGDFLAHAWYDQNHYIGYYKL
jgi:Transglutaminase-like superfamily